MRDVPVFFGYSCISKTLSERWMCANIFKRSCLNVVKRETWTMYISSPLCVTLAQYGSFSFWQYRLTPPCMLEKSVRSCPQHMRRGRRTVNIKSSFLSALIVFLQRSFIHRLLPTKSKVVFDFVIKIIVVIFFQTTKLLAGIISCLKYIE